MGLPKNQTVTLLLAGGQGERLYPLTRDRSKPSVPFAGVFRIIDFPLSNALNSGLRHIYVLTQYKSQSLNRHIRDGWNILHRELREFIETVPPQKRIHNRWYEGTADAIYQNVYLLEEMKPSNLLILSGDHIYSMNYNKMLQFHKEKKADLTIASYQFPREQASPFGVMQVDDHQQVIHFLEKPEDPPAIPGDPKYSLINMGIYVFETAPLVRAVIHDSKQSQSEHDIGKNVIPYLIESGKYRVFAYPYSQYEENPYWRDVGGLKSYFDANFDLLDTPPSISLFNSEWSFRTLIEQFPPSYLHLDHNSSSIERSFISHGTKMFGSVNRCVISPLVEIDEGSVLDHCILFHGVHIGKNCRIKNTIIDKYVVIPDNYEIGFDLEADKSRFFVTPEHLVVIPKGLKV